ncbi:MAG: ABC transporter substrate-binding protein [Alphaproteobacteria bacterium]|nr:ABC transporter substrate-binding protein [Alphaproteobacteria bacterium]
MFIRTFARAFAIALGLAAAPALAADPVNLEAARKEGRVVWYTSTPIEQAQAIAKMFEADTGIKVELFRSGGSAILRRFLQETSAGRFAVDVMTHSDPAAASALTKKGLFVPFKPVNFDKIPDTAKDANGNYIAQRLNIMTIYMRTDLVKPEDRPKTWADLLDPKYKGRMVMTDPSFTSLQLSVIGSISKERGWGFYEKLRANNIMIVPGNQQVSAAIKSGERHLAVGALDSYAAADRRSGHQITTVFPSEGTYVIPSPTAIVKGSPNPNAAKLFAQYMIGDKAQKLFPATGGYSARIDIDPPAGSPPVKDIKLLPIDYDFLEKAGAGIKRRFNEIFQ